MHRNLVCWSLAVPLCAAPSFLIAMKDHSIFGMISGVVFLLGVYLLIANSRLWTTFMVKNLVMSRAIRCSFYIKIFSVCAWGVVFVFADYLHFYAILPDVSAGYFSLMIVVNVLNISVTEASNFLPTFFITIAVGAFVSLFVVLFAILVVLPVRALIIDPWQGLSEET